ncbi:MAG: lytic transglycosylase domain-containing protein [Clostridiales bacterium]|nr:lytic transglycosylase domain-containing protein [Clostridiales bacterium]
MRAYIVQQQRAREAAYQKVLDNHPIYHMDLIERYANENNLQPAFVAAIILNESSFRTNAESGIGARGLMQLMPDTAEWIAGKLGDTHYSFDRMYEAEPNIRYGCWYLNYLSRLFRGDPVTVAAAYHAGQTTVTGWLDDPAMSPDGLKLSLEGMKDGPTKTYAGRVTQAYAIYDAIYYQEASSPDAVPVPDGQ